MSEEETRGVKKSFTCIHVYAHTSTCAFRCQSVAL